MDWKNICPWQTEAWSNMNEIAVIPLWVVGEPGDVCVEASLHWLDFFFACYVTQSDEFNILLGFFVVLVVELLSFLEWLKSECEKGDRKKRAMVSGKEGGMGTGK